MKLSNTRDVIATLVDLARRKAISITEASEESSLRIAYGLHLPP